VIQIKYGRGKTVVGCAKASTSKDQDGLDRPEM